MKPKKTPIQLNYYSIEAEHSVIGGLLLDNAAIDRIAVPLKPEMFYREDHALIYRAITESISKGKPIDLVTLFNEFEESGESEKVGGLSYLAEIANNVPSSANIHRYAEIVFERYRLRQLAAMADEITGICNSPISLSDKIEHANDRMQTVLDMDSSSNENPVSLREAVIDSIKAMNREMEEETERISSGFPEIDEMLSGGFEPGQFVIVAARPSMGKTSLGAQFALHAAKKGCTALIFSQEMTRRQIADRLLSIESSVPLEKIRNPVKSNDDYDAIVSASSRLVTLPLHIDEQSSLSFFDIATKARYTKRKFGSLGLIVIDYLQLMVGKGENRNSEIEDITRKLKGLAKTMHVPIIALSQLNRGLESRPNKRPMLSDLRDSGSVEQDADIVIAIYRDEYYNPDSIDRGTAEILIRKNRQGRCGDVRLAWRGEFAAFAQLDFSTYQSNREHYQQARADAKPFAHKRRGFAQEA